MKLKLILLPVSILLVLGIKGQTILNSGFENWSTSCAYQTEPLNWSDFKVGATTGGPSQANGGTSCTSSLTSFQGNHHMSMGYVYVQGNQEGAEQSINGLTVGNTYSVSFFAANETMYYMSQDAVKIEVYIDSIQKYVTPTMYDGGSWTEYTMQFTATKTSHLLGFLIAPDVTNQTYGEAAIDSVTISNVSGIKSSDDVPTFELSPNPSTGKTTITLSTTSNAAIIVRNSLGQQLLNKEIIQTNRYTLDLSTYPSGVYFVQLVVDGQLITKKMVKN